MIDPDEYMDMYTTHMSLYTLEDAVLCRVFRTSLKGGALSWFTKLPPNSVNSFETLASNIEVQFASSRSHRLTSIALVNILQEKWKSLRKFIDRFRKVATSIQNLSPDVSMRHIITTLPPRLFANNLCMHVAANLDELRWRAAKFMQLEELREFRNQEKAGGVKEKERQNRPTIGRVDRRRDNWGHRFMRYTPLSANRGKILDMAFSVELIPPLRKVASPENADHTRRCRYHKNSGHTT
ncbi:uncharacterized protein [Phaseolus vulgaris]|uniref:uncharacterized protein n=1 Tax=Phaseolus vulgaris TaxID=3885 RepID=UPI0035CC4609